MFDVFKTDKQQNRSLKIRDKAILYHRAGKKCEGCERRIDYTEMEVGHKNPISKGGSTSLRNSVCLCAKCNRLQGTDTWSVFMKKMRKHNKHSIVAKKLKPKKKKISREKDTGFNIPKLPKSYGNFKI